jgi:hypothetical protein
VEQGAGPGARDECCRCRDRVARQPIGELQRPLMISNAADDRSTKCEQIDEDDALVNERATQRRP